jgi:uncharacterized membrane protein YvbJ
MFCPNCGKQIPDGSKFCPYCGTNIPQTSEVSKVKEKNKRSINLKIIFIPIVIAIVLIIGIIIYLNFFPRVNPEKSAEYETKGLTVLNEIVTQNKITDEEKLKEAQDNFKKAVKLNPDNISAKKNLVYAYLISDNLLDAKKEVEDILSKNPDDQFALKMKELLSEETP